MLFTITKLSSLSRHSDSGALLRKHDTASKKRRETGESSRGMLFLSPVLNYLSAWNTLQEIVFRRLALLENLQILFYIVYNIEVIIQ